MCSFALRSIKREVRCAWCNKSFSRTPKKLKTKSGLVFCSRACKDKAQRIGGLEAIQPDHYGTEDPRYTYRKRAFEVYGKACSSCHYTHKESMLDVHHIDSNRENNALGNLEVLCVWCHAIKTRKQEWHLQQDGIALTEEKHG
jgi:hypothetical protein